jgi:hypothetical protein
VSNQASKEQVAIAVVGMIVHDLMNHDDLTGQIWDEVPRRCRNAIEESWRRMIVAQLTQVETEVPRWIRPSVGTASMYAGEHKLAVTTEWCRGWNACLDALDATGCQVDQGSPWPPINQCTDCNGAGQICTGNSGTEADGYAPILERCEVCDGTGRLGPAQKATDRIPGWCNTCTKPKHECACHK